MNAGGRRFVGIVLAACVAVGAARGIAQAVVRQLPPAQALAVGAVLIAIALFWAPVALVVGHTWRRPLPDGARLAFLLAGAVVAVLAEPAWMRAVQYAAGWTRTHYANALIGRLDTNALFYLAIVGVVRAAHRRAQRHAAARDAADLDVALATERLHALTLQLHPHFLFNSLNLASQLAYASGAQARRLLSHLRALLVESLAHASHRTVSLASEVAFLDAYLWIQEARFQERLRVAVDVAEEVRGAAVPHLLLQPLVENAIAHGISPRAEGGTVRIAAERRGDRLLLSIADDGVGMQSPLHEGLGLSITRLRLDHLYGPDQRLDITAAPRRGTVVTVTIPYAVHGAAGAREAAPEDVPPSVDGDDAALATLSNERVPLWLRVTAGWAGVAMLWTEIDALSQSARGASVMWTMSFGNSVANAALWLLLSVVPLRAARRFDLAERRTGARLLVHLALALLVAAGHVTLWFTLLHLTQPAEYRAQLVNRFPWFLWDVAAYAALVAFATAAEASARTRDTKLEMARARAALGRARVAALRLRLQPGILLRALDAIVSVVAVDAGRAEHMLARMGDLLRMLLATRDDELVPLRDELALLEAYLAVVAPGAAAAECDAAGNAPGMRVPAAMTPAIVAALGGVPLAVRCRDSGGAVEIAFVVDGAHADAGAMRDIEARLLSLGGVGTVSIASEAGGATTALLRLPVPDAARAEMSVPPALASA